MSKNIILSDDSPSSSSIKTIRTLPHRTHKTPIPVRRWKAQWFTYPLDNEEYLVLSSPINRKAVHVKTVFPEYELEDLEKEEMESEKGSTLIIRMSGDFTEVEREEEMVFDKEDIQQKQYHARPEPFISVSESENVQAELSLTRKVDRKNLALSAGSGTISLGEGQMNRGRFSDLVEEVRHVFHKIREVFRRKPRDTPSITLVQMPSDETFSKSTVSPVLKTWKVSPEQVLTTRQTNVLAEASEGLRKCPLS